MAKIPTLDHPIPVTLSIMPAYTFKLNSIAFTSNEASVICEDILLANRFKLGKNYEFIFANYENSEDESMQNVVTGTIKGIQYHGTLIGYLPIDMDINNTQYTKSGDPYNYMTYGYFVNEGKMIYCKVPVLVMKGDK